MVEPLKQSKKNKKDKKQRSRDYWQDYTGEQKEQTLATSIIIIEASSKKKYLHITCYNCDKKNHYSKSYPKPLKN